MAQGGQGVNDGLGWLGHTGLSLAATKLTIGLSHRELGNRYIFFVQGWGGGALSSILY